MHLRFIPEIWGQEICVNIFLQIINLATHKYTKTGTLPFEIVDIIAADDLVKPAARLSADLVLTKVSCNIPASALSEYSVKPAKEISLYYEYTSIEKI